MSVSNFEIQLQLNRQKIMYIVICFVLFHAFSISIHAEDLSEPDSGFRIHVEQITFGPKNHLFGYIGHVQNIPWNQSDRYIVALQTDFQERMPNPGEAADIILIDTQNDFAIEVVDETRAWNPQQGTMLYWNQASSWNLTEYECFRA